MDLNQAQAGGKVGLFSLSSYSWVVTQMAIGLHLVEFMASGVIICPCVRSPAKLRENTLRRYEHRVNPLKGAIRLMNPTQEINIVKVLQRTLDEVLRLAACNKAEIFETLIEAGANVKGVLFSRRIRRPLKP